MRTELTDRNLTLYAWPLQRMVKKEASIERLDLTHLGLLYAQFTVFIAVALFHAIRSCYAGFASMPHILIVDCAWV